MSQVKQLRSRAWFGGEYKGNFVHRSWMKNQGLPDDCFDGRPVIGICNTWSDLTPCNAHLRELAERVKRGVLRGGRLSGRVPRHLARRDRTAPDRHAVPQPGLHGRRGDAAGQPDRRRRPAGRLRQDHAGPADGRGQLRPADHRGLRRPDAQRHASAASSSAPAPTSGASPKRSTPAPCRRRDFNAAEACMSPLGRALQHHGHRLHHGLHGGGDGPGAARQRRHPGGRLAPPGAGPAVRPPHRRHGARGLRAARRSSPGRRSRTPCASTAPIGGSTNAVLHLLAIAGRLGVDFDLDDWDRAGPRHADRGRPDAVGPVPDGGLLLRRRPAGRAARPRRAGPHRRDAITVTGATLGENVADAEVYNRDVIRPLDKPLTAGGRHRRAARQSRAGRGRDQALGRHAARSCSTPAAPSCSRPSRTTTPASTTRVARRRRGLGHGAEELRPRGLPRHARGRQHGAAPQSCSQRGVTDMVRISDARMSGTAYGTVVLHAAPEAAVGGPLAARARRRRDRARRRAAPAAPPCRRRGARPPRAPARSGAALHRLPEAVRRQCPASRHRMRFRLLDRAPAGGRAPPVYLSASFVSRFAERSTQRQ